MYFLNKVGIYPKHLISTGVKSFSLGKGLRWRIKTMHKECKKNAQRVHKKVHKKFFYCTDIYVCDNFIFFFHFFAIWLSAKFKDFFIIKTLFQIPCFCLTLQRQIKKRSTKVQHVCCALICSRKVLVTTFNLGYPYYIVKDLL